MKSYFLPATKEKPRNPFRKFTFFGKFLKFFKGFLLWRLSLATAFVGDGFPWWRLSLVTAFLGDGFPWWRLSLVTAFLGDGFHWSWLSLVTAYLGPQRLGAPPWRQIFLKAMAVVIKQFREAVKKLYNNLPFYQQLSEIFLWLRNRFPKYIYPTRKSPK